MCVCVCVCVCVYVYVCVRFDSDEVEKTEGHKIFNEKEVIKTFLEWFCL